MDSFALSLADSFRPTAAHRLTATINEGPTSGIAIFRDGDGRSHIVRSGFLTDGDSMTIEPGRVELQYERDIFGRKEKIVARWRL